MLPTRWFRRRPPRPPYQGQHDWPHDETTCGRCRWLRDGKQGAPDTEITETN